MKTLSALVLFAAGLSVAPLAAVAGDTYSPWELEPCANGAVSASGLFPAQALEDEYNSLVVKMSRDGCIIGAIVVPARFPSLAMRESFLALKRQAEARC